MAGPLHAGTFGPNALDPTFGPEVRFLGIPAGMKPNRPPSEGLQFFGRLVAEAATGALRASLHNRSGREIFSTTIRAGWRLAARTARDRDHSPGGRGMAMRPPSPPPE